MRGLSGLSDFFLRKAFKFALKRNLGKYLASEIDPSQLDVQLGQGTIELRQLLLNCNELNEQLVSHWELLAASQFCFCISCPVSRAAIAHIQAYNQFLLRRLAQRLAALHHDLTHPL